MRRSRRSRLCGYLFGLASLSIAGAAAQEGERDFITPSGPPVITRAPEPTPPPPAPEPEPAEAPAEPSRPSIRTRSARPALGTSRQAARPATPGRPGAAAQGAAPPRASRPALASRPPVRPAPVARPAQVVRPASPIVRPTLARRPAASPVVADRPAPEPRSAAPEPRPAPPEVRPAPSEVRPAPTELRPAPRPAFAAGGSDSLHEELTEALRGADARFRLVGSVGGQRSLNEMLGPLGADLGVTSTVALGRAGAAPEGKARLAVVAKLFNEEVHVVARAAVGRLSDLEGKPVAVGQPGSAAEIAARDLFEAAGVRPVPVAAAGPEALAQLRSGEVAAVVAVAGRPSADLASIGPAEGLRLVPVPFAPPLHAEYYPASLPASAYPGLIGAGERVDTIAVGTVLVAPGGAENADRQRRAAVLAESFLQRFPELARSGHPKWREVNLGAQLPGWPRFEPARRWLAARPSSPAPSVSSLSLEETAR